MNKIIKQTIIVLAIVLLANIFGYLTFFRGDFSANHLYSLSEASKRVMNKIDEPINVDLYISSNTPHEYKKLGQEFIAMLKEYRSISKQTFKISLVNVENVSDIDDAINEGLKPIHIEYREGDMEMIQDIILGAVIKVGSNKEVISEITQSTPIEYELTKIFQNTLHLKKSKIGLMCGHNECSIARMPQFIKELSSLTEICFVNLQDDDNLDDYDVICIIDPRLRFTVEEINAIETYLDHGGRLFLALNHAVGQIGDNRNSGYINRVGLENMLEKYGMKINYDFIIDNSCGSINLKEQRAYLNLRNTVSLPYLPIITNFSHHIITYGLNSILLTYASSIQQVKTSSTYIFTPLARSSAISGVEQAPVFFNLQRAWSKRDFTKPNNIVAALLTNEDNKSAIVAITDADFIINEHGIYEHPLSADNINFAINSIEWLADNSGLIRLRNKFTTIPLLKPIDRNTRDILKYINVLLPIIIIIGYALWRIYNKRRKRDYRSRPGYID